MSPFVFKLLQIVCETAAQVGCEVSSVNPDGSCQSRDLVALCRGSAPFPSSGVHVLIRAQNALVSSSTSDGPQLPGDAENLEVVLYTSWVLFSRKSCIVQEVVFVKLYFLDTTFWP